MMKYEVINIKNNNYSKEIKDLFKDLYWAKNRSIDEINLMIENSYICIVIKNVNTKKVVGFARAISDGIFISTIVDVVVGNNFRGQGVGKLLIESLLNHELMKNINKQELYCKAENVKFYESLGFEVIGDLNFMRLERKKQ